MINDSCGQTILTLDSQGIVRQSSIESNSAFAKSWILRVFSSLKLELYLKICIRISLNPSSRESHFSGQKRDESRDLIHVLWESSSKSWTNIRSATTDSGGSDRVFSLKRPFESFESKLLLSPCFEKVRVRKERFGEEMSIVWRLGYLFNEDSLFSVKLSAIIQAKESAETVVLRGESSNHIGTCCRSRRSFFHLLEHEIGKRAHDWFLGPPGQDHRRWSRISSRHTLVVYLL